MAANASNRTDAFATLPPAKGRQLANQVWERYEYCKQRGHTTWSTEQKRNEEYYLGGGKQWLDADREDIEQRQKALPIELNEIFEAINTALGYQLNNRMDIAFQPRGQGATEDIAKTLTQVAMQICDNNQYPWLESQVFADGLIQQRGYLEVRVNYDDTMRGEVYISTLDPLDVIPDPDAKSYDPDDWSDVIITRWLTIEEVAALYGEKAARDVLNRVPGHSSSGGIAVNERDFGDETDEIERNKFGDENFGGVVNYDAYFVNGGVLRVRVIDRQYWRMTMAKVLITPLGDIRVIEDATPAQIKQYIADGNMITRRLTRRVRWTACTQDVVLHDAWSPFNHFSVIPFFPFFRRGKTRGMVDNARSPQDLLNKTATKQLQIVSGAANSGWITQENSLTNIDTDDLEQRGGENGLNLEYKKGFDKPEKIKPNDIPQGVDNLTRMGSAKIKGIMGVSDQLRGEGGKDQSGLSFQAQQFGAQMSLAVPLDALARTRWLLGTRIRDIVQKFYSDQRIMRITKVDAITGRKGTEELQLNWPIDENGETHGKLNDLTLGEYDVVITDQPNTITFENSQFQQLLEIKKLDPAAIPTTLLLRYSSVADRAEIIDEINAQPKGNALDDAKAALLTRQAALTDAKTVSELVQALFASIRTSQVISAVPQVAGMADTIVKSAGFKDADGGTIYPTEAQALMAGPPAPPPPENTNPTTSGNAVRGAEAGIESGELQA